MLASARYLYDAKVESVRLSRGEIVVLGGGICADVVIRRNHPGNKVSADPKFVHRRFVLYCTHGCKQRSRSTGLRTRNYTRYTNCPARITFMLVNSDEGWRYEIVHENTDHNHNVNAILAASYQYSKVFLDADLFGRELDVLIQTRARPAQVAVWLSNVTGVPVSTQRARNLLVSRMGGPGAEPRMRQILAEFLAVDGNRGALMQDEENMTVGVIIQSKMQAAMVELYHDVLACDITYNTNDLGYKMGSLLVTGPTGRGIPVFDFLTLSESKPALSTILKYFKDMNPAANNVEAFIVDKSMAEMGAIEDVFPSAAILLCQFHVKEAVGRALSQHRFALAPSLQDDISNLFSALVYARREDDYKVRLREFRDEVGSACPNLLRYFEANWFKCRDKWSNVGRAVAFSCGNSTTNRVESNWTQIKAIIGDQTGIDRCLAALIQHQLTIYRKLQTLRAHASACTRTFIGVSNFLRPVATSLADYSLDKVKTQLEYLHVDNASWSSRPAQDTVVPRPAIPATAAPPTPTRNCAAAETRRAAAVVVSTPSGEYTVDRSGDCWTCTCFFYNSQRMPCQHMMYVAQHVLNARTLSRRTVHKRWNLDTLAAIETVLNENIAAMSAIPLPTLPKRAREDANRVVQEQRVGAEAATMRSLTKLRYVRVQKGARATGPLVLGRDDKRRMLRVELEELSDLMVELNSSAFYAGVDQLRSVLAPFLRDLQTLPSADSSASGGETDGGGNTDDSRDAEASGEAWPVEFPADMTDVRECVRDRQEYVLPPESDSEDDGDDDYDMEVGPDANEPSTDASEPSIVFERRGRRDSEVLVGTVNEPSTDIDDGESTSAQSEDHGFEPGSEPDQASASSEHSSRDSVNYDSEDGGVGPATREHASASGVDRGVNIDFSPSEISLPDLDLSASSLAILEPLCSGRL